MKYLSIVLVLAMVSAELIITQQKPVAFNPITVPEIPKPQDLQTIYIDSTTKVDASNPQNVVVGKYIPGNKEFYAPAGSNQKHQKRTEKQQNNLRGGHDINTPNYYPYSSVEEYSQYEYDEDEIFATIFFIFVAFIVFIVVVTACKRRKRMRQMKRQARAVAQGNAVGAPNSIESINAQIRYHTQESERLRTYLLHQQQSQQAQQVQQYQHYQGQQQIDQRRFVPPVIAHPQLNESQNPMRRQILNESNSFNYPNYPVNYPQVPYQQFRNENQLSVIHSNNPLPSETFSDYPRL